MRIPIDALLPQWRDSERRLYPLATTATTKYEQVIRLARAVADDLGDIGSVDALVDRWESQSALVQAAGERIGVSLGDLPEAHVAGVAFALRYNEIRTREQHEETRRRLETARAEAQVWVVLHERGNLAQQLMDPYQAIEMHVGSGLGIVSSVETNPITGRVNYVLTVVRMDPTTGAAIDIDPGIVGARELENVDEFTASRAELREVLEHLG